MYDPTFYFCKIYVSSGNKYVAERTWPSRLHFLEDLNKWNRQLIDVTWHYYEISELEYNQERDKNV